MKLTLLDPHTERAETVWRALEAAAKPSYFLTWGWIETWLASLPRDEAPPLAVLDDEQGPIAACFLGQRLLVRHHVVPSRTLFVNATGLPARDDLCLEHNQLLCAPDRALTLAELVEHLPEPWDEVALAALDLDRFPGSALGEPLRDAHVVIDRVVPAPWIDLAAVRSAGDYLALLGGSTRAQIRRARRGFGSLTLEVARDEDEALAFYDEMTRLHAAHWHERHQPGAFADRWIDGFHRRLIATRLRHGEVALLRVRAGTTTVGCLYLMIANGRALFYQGGLGHFDDPHLRAGYVCHAEAVRHLAGAGHATYDLLGGGHEYKHRLATGESQLAFARIQRRRARFMLEDRARRFWKRHASSPGTRRVPPG